MDKPIDLTKPLQTHDGCSVEIIKTDLQGTAFSVRAVNHNFCLVFGIGLLGIGLTVIILAVSTWWAG